MGIRAEKMDTKSRSYAKDGYKFRKINGLRQFRRFIPETPVKVFCEMGWKRIFSIKKS